MVHILIFEVDIITMLPLKITQKRLLVIMFILFFITRYFLFFIHKSFTWNKSLSFNSCQYP